MSIIELSESRTRGLKAYLFEIEGLLLKNRDPVEFIQSVGRLFKMDCYDCDCSDDFATTNSIPDPTLSLIMFS